MRLPAAIPDRFRRLALPRARLAAALAVWLLLSEVGCSRFDLQPGWARKRLRMDDVSIADVQGPGERNVRNILRTNHEQAALEPTSEELAAQFSRLQSADRLYEEGRYVEAEAAYRAAIEVSPDLADAHARLGDLMARQGRWREAEAGYREVLRRQPDDVRARLALGAVLRRRATGR